MRREVLVIDRNRLDMAAAIRSGCTPEWGAHAAKDFALRRQGRFLLIVQTCDDMEPGLQPVTDARHCDSYNLTDEAALVEAFRFEIERAQKNSLAAISFFIATDDPVRKSLEAIATEYGATRPSV